MKFTNVTSQKHVVDGEDGLSHYYGEWHISGKLADFLDENKGKKVRITIKVLESDVDNHVYVDENGVCSIM